MKAESYREEMIKRFWAYRAEEFEGRDQLFDRRKPLGLRPPVFRTEHATYNILAGPDLTAEQRQRLVQTIQVGKRHRWFRSMTSSQALAQSVFGTLKVMGKGALLGELHTVDDENVRPFQPDEEGSIGIDLEVRVAHLGEPRPTQLDVASEGFHHVAIECKLTESDVGHCSRPDLYNGDPQHCSGVYSVQHGRMTRCALTEIGVKYWTYIPNLFEIDSEIDHIPCPIHHTYQLMRNVIAACVRQDGSVSPDASAVLLYDDRNPAFTKGGGGKGEAAFLRVRLALKDPHRLLRCTWQDLVKVLRRDGQLEWLTNELKRKYGL